MWSFAVFLVSFWRAGEVGITLEICIYCRVCILSCIVGNCIKIARNRLTGQVENITKRGLTLATAFRSFSTQGFVYEPVCMACTDYVEEQHYVLDGRRVCPDGS